MYQSSIGEDQKYRINWRSSWAFAADFSFPVDSASIDGAVSGLLSVDIARKIEALERRNGSRLLDDFIPVPVLMRKNCQVRIFPRLYFERDDQLYAMCGAPELIIQRGS